jgi:hypothetical protein
MRAQKGSWVTVNVHTTIPTTNNRSSRDYGKRLALGAADRAVEVGHRESDVDQAGEEGGAVDRASDSGTALRGRLQGTAL